MIFMSCDRAPSNIDAVMISEAIHVFPGVVIFDFAVAVIVKFDCRNVPLNQTPEKPVDIRERLKEIGHILMMIRTAVLPIDGQQSPFHLRGEQDFLEQVGQVIIGGSHPAVFPVDQEDGSLESLSVFGQDKVIREEVVVAGDVLRRRDVGNITDFLNDLNCFRNIELRVVGMDVRQDLV